MHLPSRYDCLQSEVYRRSQHISTYHSNTNSTVQFSSVTCGCLDSPRCRQDGRQREVCAAVHHKSKRGRPRSGKIGSHDWLNISGKLGFFLNVPQSLSHIFYFLFGTTLNWNQAVGLAGQVSVIGLQLARYHIYCDNRHFN